MNFLHIYKLWPVILKLWMNINDIYRKTETPGKSEIGILGAIGWQCCPTRYHVIVSVLEFSCHRALDCELFIWIMFVMAAPWQFCRQFSQHNVSSCNTVLMWVFGYQSFKKVVLPTRATWICSYREKYCLSVKMQSPKIEC